MSAPINTPFSVVAEIRDPDGDVCANGEADVPCVISIDTRPSGSEAAVLSGTLTRTPVAGVLTFNDLQIDVAGNGYTLKVQPVDEVDGLVAKVSGSFTIGSSEEVISVGVAEYDGTLWGFRASHPITGDPFGTATPSTFKGSQIIALYQELGSNSALYIEGTHPQNFFTSIATSTNTILSSAAFHINQNDGGYFWTLWTWGVPIFDNTEYTTNATFTY